MRLVNVNNLTSKMKLAKPIYHQDRVLLYPECNGDLLNYQDRLVELGIHYIYVEDSKSKGIKVEDVIDPETRQKSKQTVRKTFENISEHKKINVEKVTETVKNLVEEVLENDNVLVNLLDIKTTDSYTYDHSVNVAVLSLLIGKKINLSRQRMIKLGVGAILHDIGKIAIPEEILKKPDSLTKKEYEAVKKHPQLGYENTKDYHDISPVSRIIILSHHEKINGNGYPKGLKKDEIHEFARLVAVTDVFDALTSDRCYRDRWPVHKATDFLISNAGNHFDARFVEKFIHNIAIYPNGVKVILSNGEEGIVQKQNEGFPERPVVRVIKDENGKELDEYKTVNLMEKLNLVIEDSEG